MHKANYTQARRGLLRTTNHLSDHTYIRFVTKLISFPSYKLSVCVFVCGLVVT